MSGFLRLLAAASIVGGLAILLRELFRERTELLRPASGGQVESKSRPKPKRSQAQTRSDGTGPSREKLYEEAQRLEIKGRSKMKKDELERAVKKARAAR
jgi:hypothetical protein